MAREKMNIIQKGKNLLTTVKNFFKSLSPTEVRKRKRVEEERLKKERVIKKNKSTQDKIETKTKKITQPSDTDILREFGGKLVSSPETKASTERSKRDLFRKSLRYLNTYDDSGVLWDIATRLADRKGVSEVLRHFSDRDVKYAVADILNTLNISSMEVFEAYPDIMIGIISLSDAVSNFNDIDSGTKLNEDPIYVSAMNTVLSGLEKFYIDTDKKYTDYFNSYQEQVDNVLAGEVKSVDDDSELSIASHFNRG